MPRRKLSLAKINSCSRKKERKMRLSQILFMKKKEKENQFVTSRWVRVGETTTCSKLAMKFENKGTQNSLTMNINMHASNFDKEKIKLWHQKNQTKPPINTEKKYDLFCLWKPCTFSKHRFFWNAVL